MSKTKIIEQPFSHRMLLFVDVLMISLVIIDLVLIAFDSLFAVKIIKEQFDALAQLLFQKPMKNAVE